MRLSRILFPVLAASLIAGAALAQGFPTLSFEQMIALDQQLIREQRRPERPGDLFFNPGENGGGRTQAVYTGQSRPLDQRRSAFITAFASTSVGNDNYAALYQREYRFTAGGKDWWLPVQAQVASYFARELKPGQPVMLYVRNAGGFRLSDSWDWVFLVEEFDSPAAQPDKPPPPSAPAKPPARKKFTAPPGPKIET